MTEGDVRHFVKEAGNIISLSKEKQLEIIKRLEEECISQKWQLQSVSNELWESMGAPAGFDVILRNCFDRQADRALEELKEIISSDVKQVITSSTQPHVRKSRTGSRRLPKSSSMGDLRLDEDNKEEASPVALALRRRNSIGPRRRKSKSVESLNDSHLRVSKSPEKRRAVIGHDASDKKMDMEGNRRGSSSLGSRQRQSRSMEQLNDKELEIQGQRRRRRSSRSKSNERLNDVDNVDDNNGRRLRKSKSVESLNDSHRRVSKSPEKHRAVIGHDGSDKRLHMAGNRRGSSSLGSRQRQSRSMEQLNDVNRRVSKSPDKELEIQGQRRRRSSRSKSNERLNDVDNVDDNNGPRRRKSKSVETLNDAKDNDSSRLRSGSLGPDLDASNEDSNSITRGRRRRHSVGHRRLSKSPEKHFAMTDHDGSSSELDAVERSRRLREQSRRRFLKKTASTSSIIPLKGEDKSSISISSRRSTKSTSGGENNTSISSRQRHPNATSGEESSISSRRRPTKGTSSNHSASGPNLKRSHVLAPPPQSPGGLAQHTSLADNDATMKSRRLARTKKRSGAGRLHSESKSPSRSFSRCQSESPSSKRALLSERHLSAAPQFRRANSFVHLGHAAVKLESPQFQSSLKHAIPSNNKNRSDISFDDCSLQSSRSLEHSTSVKKDVDTGRFCYMSCGRIMYEWDQSFDTMSLVVPKPPEVPEEDVVCTIEELSLQLGRKDDDQAFFHRLLGGKCDPEKSIWVAYGGAEVKGFIVELKKANPGEKWKRPLLTVTGNKGKKKKQLNRRDSVPEDFGSPRLRPRSVADADLATPQHANRPGKTSKHSADFLLNLPNEEHGNGDEGSYWGSTCSLPQLGRSIKEEAYEKQSKEKNKHMRRIKKGGRQIILQAASVMSPFLLKQGKSRSASTKIVATCTSDSPSPDELKEKTLDFRNSTHEEPEPSPKQPESELNSFSDMLVAAAPLPFYGDDNTTSTLGSKETAPITETKQLLGPTPESKEPSGLPYQAPRSSSRVLPLVGGSWGGPSSPRYREY
eukprot:CAMPEP_0113644158 /NCGR_PEP_ID=MMETSP0017_2-20120614/23234_1 /TAXON_ID=2856 /ORGANISM="Cylindrotheca closterium" /LENGTH=1033 /DNA_ID=CAMNT_0000555741 /DNA_START=91 /DNA_END=3192 /DNA_ORIENTATION=+ /assembly_acc=CAM_ASM_000147